jgi:hypothetical protein|tara:strand:- start:16237 stop:16404 length:168 start_codon:yes stop_codon:yes gene_type:complete
MPNQRSTNKTQINCWVQDGDVLERYCKETGKTRTQVVQELINELKDKQKKIKKNG